MLTLDLFGHIREKPTKIHVLLKKWKKKGKEENLGDGRKMQKGNIVSSDTQLFALSPVWLICLKAEASVLRPCVAIAM